MDHSMTSKCSGILKKLMNHSSAWVFKMPVDPVALNIPDYFSIISKPLDLGTIKSKLDKNIYHAADEFESDVRLTFANAIRYNPPTNQVHQMEKEMDAYFGTLWRHVGENSRLDVLPEVEVTGRCDVSSSCPEKQSSDFDFDRVPMRMNAMDMGASSARNQKSNIKVVNDGNSKCSKDSFVVRYVPDSSGIGRLGENMKIKGMKGASLRKLNTPASETEVAKNVCDI